MKIEQASSWQVLVEDSQISPARQVALPQAHGCEELEKDPLVTLQGSVRHVLLLQAQCDEGQVCKDTDDEHVGWHAIPDHTQRGNGHVWDVKLKQWG